MKIKNIIIAISVIIIIAFIFGGFLFYLYQQASKYAVEEKKENPNEVKLSDDLIKSMTPPPGSKPVEMSDELRKQMTAPEGSEPIEVSDELIKSMTPTE